MLFRLGLIWLSDNVLTKDQFKNSTLAANPEAVERPRVSHIGHAGPLDPTKWSCVSVTWNGSATTRHAERKEVCSVSAKSILLIHPDWTTAVPCL